MVARPPLTGVSVEAVRNAIAQVPYWESHARRVYAMVDDDLVQVRALAKALKEWAADPKSGFPKDRAVSVRWVQRKRRAGLRSAHDVTTAFEGLQERGWGRIQRKRVDGQGRTSVVFEFTSKAINGVIEALGDDE